MIDDEIINLLGKYIACGDMEKAKELIEEYNITPGMIKPNKGSLFFGGQIAFNKEKENG